MQISVEWGKPIKLHDGTSENLIYRIDNLENLPNGPGVYVFARKFGRNIVPLYIGRAVRLRRRIEQQLLTNVQLMMSIRKAEIGHRILLIGKLDLKPGQKVPKVLSILEPALIEYALAEGHELFNIAGAKTPVDRILSKGNLASRRVAPLRMNIRRRK
jgi:hypothetical protein